MVGQWLVELGVGESESGEVVTVVFDWMECVFAIDLHPMVSEDMGSLSTPKGRQFFIPIREIIK